MSTVGSTCCPRSYTLVPRMPSALQRRCHESRLDALSELTARGPLISARKRDFTLHQPLAAAALAVGRPATRARTCPARRVAVGRRACGAAHGVWARVGGDPFRPGARVGNVIWHVQ